jgi:hypothetical protein
MAEGGSVCCGFVVHALVGTAACWKGEGSNPCLCGDEAADEAFPDGAGRT